MAAGELRHRIELQDRALTENASADLDAAFSTVAIRFAGVRTVNASQPGPGGVELSEIQTHVFRLRYDSAIASSVRIGKWIRFNGRRFRIAAVENEAERNLWWNVSAEEDSDV